MGEFYNSVADGLFVRQPECDLSDYPAMASLIGVPKVKWELYQISEDIRRAVYHRLRGDHDMDVWVSLSTLCSRSTALQDMTEDDARTLASVCAGERSGEDMAAAIRVIIIRHCEEYRNAATAALLAMVKECEQ